jgi:ADP-ribosylation factor GTPase-activating protein 2/3
VHLSFVRSTTLDTWTEDQLQTMALGGNHRARAFFKQHGWDEVGSDKIEAKYTSGAAQLYRKQLEKDVAKAITEGTHGIEGGATERPKAAGVSLKAVSQTSTENGNGASKASGALGASRSTAGASAKSRLGTGRRPNAAKSTGLGIKKLNAQIDDSLFDQAPAEEEKDDEGLDEPETFEEGALGDRPAPSSRFAMDTLESKHRPAIQRGKDGHLTLDASDDFFADPFGETQKEAKSPTATAATAAEWRRDGMSGGSRTRAGHVKNTGQAPSQPDSGEAQARFGNAKSISSSAFFNQDQNDNDYERQTRLSQFQGSNAISSDAYFGRESRNKGSDSFDVSASDLMSKISFTARQDMQQLKTLASEAGSKLSRLAQSFMRDLQGGF